MNTKLFEREIGKYEVCREKYNNIQERVYIVNSCTNVVYLYVRFIRTSMNFEAKGEKTDIRRPLVAITSIYKIKLNHLLIIKGKEPSRIKFSLKNWIF